MSLPTSFPSQIRYLGVSCITSQVVNETLKGTLYNLPNWDFEVLLRYKTPLVRTEPVVRVMLPAPRRSTDAGSSARTPGWHQ